MKRACVATIALVACAMGISFSQTPQDPTKPQLRKGVNVQLPTTTRAIEIPEADDENATVLAMTHDGKLYLGAAPIAASTLPEKLSGKSTVYLKLDARLAFSRVAPVLRAVKTSGAHAVLLTAQSAEARSGQIATPTGLQLELASRPGNVAVKPKNTQTVQQVVAEIENAGVNAALEF